MLTKLARRVPLAWFAPLRRGAVGFRRGSLPRGACIALLKAAAAAHRGGLQARGLAEIRPARRRRDQLRPE